MKKNIARRRRNQGFTLVELMIVVAIIGVLAVLAVFGVRKYIASAKTAEARNSVGRMAKDAALAYEREHIAGGALTSGPTPITHQLCMPSSNPVPAVASVTGTKYQSTKLDWNDPTDLANHAGFPCLKFEMTAPQYYSYSYVSASQTDPNAGTFQASATGDLDGNAVTSNFRLDGSLINGRVHIAPALTETNPDE